MTILQNPVIPIVVRFSMSECSLRVENRRTLESIRPEDDARAEGVEPFFARFQEIGRDQRITTGELAADGEHRASFACTWDEIPWVWRIAFKRVEVPRG